MLVDNLPCVSANLSSVLRWHSHPGSARTVATRYSRSSTAKPAGISAAESACGRVSRWSQSFNSRQMDDWLDKDLMNLGGGSRSVSVVVQRQVHFRRSG